VVHLLENPAAAKVILPREATYATRECLIPDLRTDKRRAKITKERANKLGAPSGRICATLRPGDVAFIEVLSGLEL